MVALEITGVRLEAERIGAAAEPIGNPGVNALDFLPGGILQLVVDDCDNACRVIRAFGLIADAEWQIGGRCKNFAQAGVEQDEVCIFAAERLIVVGDRADDPTLVADMEIACLQAEPFDCFRRKFRSKGQRRCPLGSEVSAASSQNEDSAGCPRTWREFARSEGIALLNGVALAKRRRLERSAPATLDRERIDWLIKNAEFWCG